MPERDGSSRHDWQREIATRLAQAKIRGEARPDLIQELAQHCEDRYEELREKGESEAPARESILGELEDMERFAASLPGKRTEPWIEPAPQGAAFPDGLLGGMLRDLRYALRTLGKAPAFTAVMVATMALAIGANSAIFSVVEGVLLRPLPYPHADRLVRIFFHSERFPKFPLNPWDLRDFRDGNRTFDSIAAITRADVQLSGAGEPIMLHTFLTTSGYFHVLGLAPARGREFTKEDEGIGHEHSVIISDRVWRTVLGSDPEIVGKRITLDAAPYTVVGVMPPGVQHPGNTYRAVPDGETVDLWLPFVYQGDSSDRGSHYLDAIGRLKPGITAGQGQADLMALLNQMAKDHPNDRRWQLNVVPLFQETVGRAERMLLVLLGAVGVVLLIACVNAANLLLARGTSRQREIAIRSAVGAARSRLVRQLLTESLVISMAGGVVGSVLAIEGVRALVLLLPAGFPRASAIHVDTGVLFYTLAVAIATGLFFGLAPALDASRTDLQQALREGGRSATASRGHVRLRSLLVVGETSLACLLLIGAGLLLHSFVNLLRADPGFQPEHVLTASMSLPLNEYAKAAPEGSNQAMMEAYAKQGALSIARFYDRLVSKMETQPGVEAVGVGSDLPWTGYDDNIGGFLVEGKPAAVNDNTTARYHTASENYFRAMGIPLLRGRFFTAHDTEDAAKVIVINATMAARYWPGEDAVGKRISFDDHPQEKDWVRVAGVVGDVKDEPNAAAAHPAFWWPMKQRAWPDGNMVIVVRSTSEAAGLAGELRAVVRELDPALALADVRVMDQIADQAVAGERFALFLVALFAGLALVLATIGVYGVISYSVNQQMHEFGMRVALGAGRWDVMGMILGRGMRLAGIGTLIGLVCGVALGRVLGNLLYSVRAVDPLTFLLVAVVALATAVSACYLPARRATEVDPMEALRTE